MKRFKTKSEILLFLVMISCLLIIPNVNCSNSTGILYAFPKEQPIIDGSFEEEIWNDTLANEITMYNYYNQNESFVMKIKAAFNETIGNLTLGFLIPDMTYDDDVLLVAFKQNESHPFIDKQVDWGWSINNDLKIYYQISNSSVDCLTTSGTFDGDYDTNHGGSEDCYARGTHNGEEYQIEMTMTLDSNDIQGKDISLIRGDSIDFFIYYYETTTGKVYTQVRTADNNWDYNILYLGEPETTNTNSLIIGLTFIGSLGLICLNVKKEIS